MHTTLAQTPATGPYTPAFFTPAEYATLSRLTDVIIPPTDTPGAAAAGVPEYIDRVVSLNAEHQPLVRAGLAWLERQAKDAVLARVPVARRSRARRDPAAAQRRDRSPAARGAARGGFAPRRRARTVYYVAVTDKDPPARPRRPAPRRRRSTDPDLPVRFFRLIKNLTADGYYTSRVGLLEELGYAGNTALARFPACAVPEH